MSHREAPTHLPPHKKLPLGPRPTHLAVSVFVWKQLFIFYTIKIFGPVVFAIIMSTRILVSIAVSCFLYDHPIPPLGA